MVFRGRAGRVSTGLECIYRSTASAAMITILRGSVILYVTLLCIMQGKSTAAIADNFEASLTDTRDGVETCDGIDQLELAMTKTQTPLTASDPHQQSGIGQLYYNISTEHLFVSRPSRVENGYIYIHAQPVLIIAISSCCKPASY